MKLLLRFGATHRPLSESGDTLLHAVATFPDVRIIEHLLDCDLSDEDVDARNRDHLTARELLQMHNSDPKIALAFQKLLTKVSNKWKPNVARVSEVLDDSDSDSSGEIFEDVAEQ